MQTGTKIHTFRHVFQTFTNSSSFEITRHLTLIREFLGQEPSAISGKNSEYIACNLTVGSKIIKLCVQIEGQFGYVMMLISNDICH